MNDQAKTQSTQATSSREGGLSLSRVLQAKGLVGDILYETAPGVHTVRAVECDHKVSSMRRHCIDCLAEALGSAIENEGLADSWVRQLIASRKTEALVYQAAEDIDTPND